MNIPMITPMIPRTREMIPTRRVHGSPIRFDRHELLEVPGESHSLFEGLVLKLHVILEKLLPPDVAEDEPNAYDHGR
jgi:hypothetical protein